MASIMDTFGEWLIGELKQRDISQSKLARLSGLSEGTISNIISGTRGRGPDSLEAIARALKLPVDFVYRRAGLLPEEPDADPWVDEMTHKLKMIAPGMRGFATTVINSLVEGKETEKRRTKSSAASSAKKA